jgi:hypothetical protein
MNKALNPKVVNPKPCVGHETKGEERVSLKISENPPKCAMPLPREDP